MSSTRLISFSVLSTLCLATLLYYSFLPKVPGLITVPNPPSTPAASTAAEITVQAEKFTPEVLLSAPRRSFAVPNARGTLALYTTTTYSFESHRKTSEIRVLHIDSGQSTLITDDEHAREPHWLGNGNELIWLKAGGKKDGKEANQTESIIVVGSADKIGNEYKAATIPGSIAHVKLKTLDQDRIAIAFVAKARPDGSMFNPDNEPKQFASGKVYNSVMVRHWDEYVTPQRNAIWYGLLQRDPHGRYRMLGSINALKGSPFESPIAPSGGPDHFDLSTNGIIFVAKDPVLNPAFNTKCDFYYVAIEDFTKAPSSMPQTAQVKGLEGAATSPVFSPQGNSAVFLKMKENGYESDKNRIIIVPDVSKPSTTTEALSSDDGKGAWDRSPGGVQWSNDGKMLLLEAEESGRALLFKLPLRINPPDRHILPEPVTSSGYLSNAFPLAVNSSELFVSSTNLVDNSVYTIVNPTNPSAARQVSSNSQDGTSFSLSKDQVSEIWFPGAGEQMVHAWVVKPSTFNSSHRYPLAYLIHGGPQGAWGDEWSTRWNPAVFAEQGYVVVTPNPTGSTGYGQAFCDAIKESWGGLPYQDLVNGFDYIKENLTFVDTDRAVALGASYGGYMMNWMQGHGLGRKFKALVCHDGVFSMVNQMSSDEQYFPNHDLGGAYYENMEVWQKWDPAAFTGNWSTPQLVIHNELDYRLPISEGLAVFNVLQERGIDSKFLTFPDENHWVLNEENSLLWHTVVLNWINKYAGLPPYKEDYELDYTVQSRPLTQSNDDKDTNDMRVK